MKKVENKKSIRVFIRYKNTDDVIKSKVSLINKDKESGKDKISHTTICNGNSSITTLLIKNSKIVIITTRKDKSIKTTTHITNKTINKGIVEINLL